MNQFAIGKYGDLQGFVSVSDTTTRSILTGQQIRAFIRGSSNVVVAVFLLVLAIPLVTFLYFLLAYQVWKLRRYALKDFRLNVDNYKACRQQLSKLSSQVDQLRPVLNIQLNQTKWYDRPLVKLALEASRTIATRHSRLEAKFAALDTPPASLPEGWRAVSGLDLWQGRPKDYEYLI